MSITQRTCSIEGCDEPPRCRGWCDKHYSRWRRHGDPLVNLHRNAEQRFHQRVDRQGPDECWPWTGGVTDDGYGVLAVSGVDRRAHRLAYELLISPIPAGLQIDHTCHNRDESCAGGPRCPHRRCCNPAHLELVTSAVNTARGRAGALNAAKTHCPAGHPYEGDNLIERGGRRHCRECGRAAGRRWVAAHRNVTARDADR